MSSKQHITRHNLVLSSWKGLFVLLVIFVITVNQISAQVISNTGAHITVTTGAVVVSKEVENSIGTLGNDGTITLSGGYLNNATTGGNGYYNLMGNWTNNGIFNAGTSTVTLHGTVNQTIYHGSSGESFYRLIINNPGKIITQIANPGSSLVIQNDLTVTAGTLSLGSTTSNLNVGGKATVDGALVYDGTITQTATIIDNLSGAGYLDMSGGSRPHLLNLAGATNLINTFITSPTSSSTVNYNGTNQTVFGANNYRNLKISNSGIKTLQGNSIVGINLDITGGTLDLGAVSTFNVQGLTAIGGGLSFGTTPKTATLNGNLSGTGSIDMTGNNLTQLLNLYGASNSIGSYTSGTQSTVDYILNGNQIVFISPNYRNLRITGSGVKTLYSDIAASGILTMLSGNIDANGNTLKLTNSAISALVRTTGTIIGKFQRAIGTIGSNYLYPLGTPTVYNPMKISFNTLTGGPLTAQYKPEDVGPVATPLDDDGNEIYDRYVTGYWSLSSVAPLDPRSYNVNLNFSGFTAVDQSASIITRTNGGDLSLDGAHGTIIGSEITRNTMVNGIAPTTTDLALGKGRPRITSQPQNIDVCQGSYAYFEVTARGRGSLTYQWQISINGGTTFNDIPDGGIYGLTPKTKKLEISTAPYSMNGYLYRCVIKDNQGNPNTTNAVLLTVNLIPSAVPTPSTQNVCTGVAFTTISLASYSPTTGGSVPGTTFAWTRDTPAGIVTNLPTSDAATGDQINGTFSNTTDAPITITFTITPTGPGTTFCIGPTAIATVTVNPTPQVFTTPAISAQCDLTATNITLSSPSTFTSGLISFRYTVSTTDRFLVSSPGAVTGYSAQSSLSDGHKITDVLVNHTDGYQIVTYYVTPMSPLGCADGPPKEIKVTVNPTPRVVPINIANLKADTSICYAGITEILLTSPTIMYTGFGNMLFDYTVTKTGASGVVTGNFNPAVNKIPGDKIIYKYRNLSDTLQSVYFHLTPKVDNAACVSGNIVTSEVKVHPKSIDYSYPGTNGTGILITKPLTCDISSGLAALRIVTSKGAGPYHTIWTGPVGYQRIDSIDIKNLNIGKYTVIVTDNLGCDTLTAINVVPFTARPQIFALPILPNIHVSCPGGSDGTIRAYVSSGITAPYNYTVTRNGAPTGISGTFPAIYNPADPNTFRVLTGLTAGTYAIIITDVNGCVVPKTVDLLEPDPIRVNYTKSNYSGFNVSCKGYANGSANAQATGGNGTYSYFWYAESFTLTVSHNTSLLDSIPSGKYYVIVTDMLNCSHLDSVTLNEPSGMQLVSSELSLSADNNTNISCNGGSDGFIKLTISGGAAPYGHSWTGPGSPLPATKDISGLKAGTYITTVTDNNGCVLRLLPGSTLPSFTLTEPLPLVISSVPSVSSDGGYNINCNGGTGTIAISVTGGSVGNYTYTWTTNNGSGIVQGQKDQNALKAGTYHLVVKDLNGCEISKDFTLTEPPAFSLNLVGKDITCQSPGFNNGSVDLSVTGGVAPYIYLWSNGATTQDIANLTEGYYKVRVTYNNVCSKSDSVRINLPPPLTYTKSVSDYNGFNISCNGQADGSISITPTSGLEPIIYVWTGPNGFTASTKNISNLRAGSYTLVMTDNNYCTATETIVLNEPGLLGMLFNLSQSTAGGFNINCAGDSTGTIGVEPLNFVRSVSYLWSDGIFGKTRTNLAAGTYDIIIIDANNCHAAGSVSLTEPDSLKLKFDVTKPFCPDMPNGEIRLDVTGGVKGTDYSYKWSDRSTAGVLTDVVKGLFSVTVTDLNGCSVKDSVTVKPQQETCLIIPNAISPNDDLINDVWNIGMINLYPNVEIKIFNRWGEMIWKSDRGYPKPWDGRSNGLILPIDSYHYIIDLNNGTKPLIGSITVVK